MGKGTSGLAGFWNHLFLIVHEIRYVKNDEIRLN